MPRPAFLCGFAGALVVKWNGGPQPEIKKKKMSKLWPCKRSFVSLLASRFPPPTPFTQWPLGFSFWPSGPLHPLFHECPRWWGKWPPPWPSLFPYRPPPAPSFGEGFSEYLAESLAARWAVFHLPEGLPHSKNL